LKLREYINQIVALFKQNSGESAHHSEPTHDYGKGIAPALRAIVRIIHSATDTYKTQQKQNWGKRVLEIATFVIVAFYATVTFLQLLATREAIRAASEANQLAELSAARSNNRMIEANKIAVNSERPWMGMGITIQDWAVDKSPRVIVFFSNTGRRPAKVFRVRSDSNDFKAFPQNPPYRRQATDVASVALVVPNSALTNTIPLNRLTQIRLNELASRQYTFFVYASIEYEDVLTRANHWTHGCWQYLPGFENAASGFVNCSTYNETDQ
jgi:hypothetical protein